MVEKRSSRSGTPKSNQFQTLMGRLSRAGFKEAFVRSAILPEWWEDSCDQDPDLLPDFEMRVARFLGLPVSSVKDADTVLVPPLYPAAQLRRVRDVNRDRLAPAIHAAIQIGAATVRSLRDPAHHPAVPPPDGLRWREKIERGGAVTLHNILGDLWQRGIPIVPLKLLPAPSFQAIVCIVEDRPVILLGYQHDEPGRVAFLIAHETGHIAVGDCAPDQPVVDEEEEIRDDTEIRVDQYAKDVLVGSVEVPRLQDGAFRQLANDSARLERETGVDAGAIISAWAARTGDYAKATMALKALYLSFGARRQISQHFRKYVDIEAATESDRSLLRCVHGNAEWDETVG